MEIEKNITDDEIWIEYTVEDNGNITTFILTLEQIENGKLFSILHDSERYTCLAKVIKRELHDKER